MSDYGGEYAVSEAEELQIQLAVSESEAMAKKNAAALVAMQKKLDVEKEHEHEKKVGRRRITRSAAAAAGLCTPINKPTPGTTPTSKVAPTARSLQLLPATKLRRGPTGEKIQIQIPEAVAEGEGGPSIPGMERIANPKWAFAKTQITPEEIQAMGKEADVHSIPWENATLLDQAFSQEQLGERLQQAVYNTEKIDVSHPQFGRFLEENFVKEFQDFNGVEGEHKEQYVTSRYSPDASEKRPGQNSKLWKFMTDKSGRGVDSKIQETDFDAGYTSVRGKAKATKKKKVAHVAKGAGILPSHTHGSWMKKEGFGVEGHSWYVT